MYVTSSASGPSGHHNCWQRIGGQLRPMASGTNVPGVQTVSFVEGWGVCKRQRNAESFSLTSDDFYGFYTLLAKWSNSGGFLFFKVLYTLCKATFGVSALYIVVSFPWFDRAGREIPGAIYPEIYSKLIRKSKWKNLCACWCARPDPCDT